MSTTAYPHPEFHKARKVHLEEQHSYVNSYLASSMIGLNGHMFNRITGIVYVYCGEKRYPVSDSDKKINIGLQLKHFKQVISIDFETRLKSILIAAISNV